MSTLFEKVFCVQLAVSKEGGGQFQRPNLKLNNIAVKRTVYIVLPGRQGRRFYIEAFQPHTKAMINL